MKKIKYFISAIFMVFSYFAQPSDKQYFIDAIHNKMNGYHPFVNEPILSWNEFEDNFRRSYNNLDIPIIFPVDGYVNPSSYCDSVCNDNVAMCIKTILDESDYDKFCELKLPCILINPKHDIFSILDKSSDFASGCILMCIAMYYFSKFKEDDIVLRTRLRVNYLFNEFIDDTLKHNTSLQTILASSMVGHGIVAFAYSCDELFKNQGKWANIIKGVSAGTMLLPYYMFYFHFYYQFFQESFIVDFFCKYALKNDLISLRYFFNLKDFAINYFYNKYRKDEKFRQEIGRIGFFSKDFRFKITKLFDRIGRFLKIGINDGSFKVKKIDEALRQRFGIVISYNQYLMQAIKDISHLILNKDDFKKVYDNFVPLSVDLE